MRKGFLLVIESIDGGGTETQSNLLKEFLIKKQKKIEFLRYPDYNGPIGKLIHDFLYKKFDFSPAVQFSIYATDMVKDKEKIENALKDGRIIVADRYVTTTLAYQSVRGFSIERGLKFIELFGLPKPDLVIFLDISPETSMKRKLKEKNDLDRHEADGNFLGKVSDSYKHLAKDNIFSKEWVIIDGEKPIEEVAKEIQKILTARLK